MSRVMVLLTCHNRREHTRDCLMSLLEGCPDTIRVDVVAVDAGSTDGTVEMLEEFRLPRGKLKLLKRDDSLFWNGGMRVAMNHAARMCEPHDYILLVNDDVHFFPGVLVRLLDRIRKYKVDAVVGATKDSRGEQTYGGVRQDSKLFARFSLIPPTEEPEQCDTFNCNCLLLTKECFLAMGNLDGAYVHSMGDYDYGLRLKREGRIVINTESYVGSCEDNDESGSWKDKSLPRRERFQKKESPKGLPAEDWFHFVAKNYGLAPALYHSATPYIKIILGI